MGKRARVSGLSPEPSLIECMHILYCLFIRAVIVTLGLPSSILSALLQGSIDSPHSPSLWSMRAPFRYDETWHAERAPR